LVGPIGSGKLSAAKMIHNNGQQKHKQFASLNLGFFQSGLVETHFWSALKEIFQRYESEIPGHKEPLYGTLFINGLTGHDISFKLSLIEVLKNRGQRDDNVFTRDIKVVIGIAPEEIKELENALSDFSRIEVPSLKERKEDIPALLNYWVERYGQKYNKKVNGISIDLLGILLRYSWPGNIREMGLLLKAVIAGLPHEQRGGGSLDMENFPLDAEMLKDIYSQPESGGFLSSDKAQASFEKGLLKVLWQKSAGDLAKTAAYLGIREEALSLKLEEYNLV
jgi:DNA-binding NtrC family response regulator